MPAQRELHGARLADAKPVEAAGDDSTPTGWKTVRTCRRWCLLGILAGYVILAPYLGYMVATAVLLGVVAAYGGAPLNRNLLLVSAGGGICLWLSFAWALSIPMQTSVLLDWF